MSNYPLLLADQASLRDFMDYILAPLLIMALLIIYVGLLSYFEQRIFSVLVKVVEEGSNVDELPKLPEHLSEACIADDIKDRISRRFVLSVIMIWFLYNALLFFNCFSNF